MQSSRSQDLTPVTLNHRGPVHYQAGIAPGFGANLVSFRADGTEWIHFDREQARTGEKFTGAFNMFPTPCRLANCAYTFDGRRISQTKRGQPVFIHGLVRDEAFAYEAGAAAMTSRLEIGPDSPVYEGFPFVCTLELVHALSDAGLTVTYRVINRDRRRLPFAYGLHPYWRIPGSRDRARIRIPCERTLRLDELVPTGGTDPVAGSPFDFRAPAPLGRLAPDHVYWKRPAGETATLELADQGLRLRISASPEFGHLIVYSTETAPFVCIESLTSSPNAQNLADSAPDVANLQVVEPGCTAEGWIRYAVERVSA